MRRFRRNRVPRRPEFWPRAWRRHPLAFVILLAVAGVLSYQRVKTPFGTDHERYHNRTFTCIHVVDGDTFDIDAVDGMRASTRVRLWGVDTPETVKPGTAPMHFGPEASAYAKSRLLGQRVRIVLAPDRTRDRYDRLLAYVYPPDSQSTLNEDLIEQGFAYADPRFPHPWRERFLQLEERARKAKAGLWAAVRPEQMPEWRQRMEGRRKDAATR
ncbi:MAG TPA: thermonuclease family protein [Phycisphaerae bacterium]|nr:thermonuclease family protein [Phycisphaerae bacterium]